LKWQREQGVRGNWQSSTSPFGSPLRRRPQNLSLDNLADDLKGNLTVSERNQILDQQQYWRLKDMQSIWY